MKKESRIKTKQVTAYWAKCRFCGKEIKGSKFEEVEWNIDLHEKYCNQKNKEVKNGIQQ